MSRPTTRPLPPRVVLQSDLLRPHGPRVTVCSMDGRELGSLDRPLAEFLQEALERKASAA
jgi:hypothetical protein